MPNPDLLSVLVRFTISEVTGVAVSFSTEAKEGREGKDVSCTEELELELEALEIADDPLELEAAEEAENEELAKKLLDEQGG